MVWDKYNRSNGGVTIDFYPNTLDNIFWSKENIVAVGGSDHVSLFVPRIKTTSSDDRRWDRINLKTSLFTLDDIQLQLPLSWKNFSIGEEMSEAYVHSLDWSPPGLGKHKRSVLAVLTSNHVLSIWECVGKPEIATDWVRAYVVNHGLQKHFKAKDSRGPEESEADHFERFRAKQRIRSFAWSQAPPVSSLSGTSGDCATKRPYLAVSTDRGEVFILDIQSPFDLLNPDSGQWNASVVTSFSVEVPEAKQSPLAACMPVTFKWRSPFVDQLAWSPWASDPDGNSTSALAFTAQSSLQCKAVKLVDADNHTRVTLGETKNLLESQADTQAVGCMRWAPRLKSARDAFLIYPTRKSFHCLHTQPGLGAKFEASVQEINTPWDEIAGATFVYDDNDNVSVQFAYHLSSSSDRITSLELPFTLKSEVGSSTWQRDLLRGQSRFSDEYSLAGNAMTRSYGLCTSPFGDMVAINASFHQSDGVEYTTSSDEVSYLITSSVHDDMSFALAGSSSHSYELSSEALLFSLQSLALRQPDMITENAFLLEQITQTIDLTDLPSVTSNQGQITEDTPVEFIVRQVRQNILFNRDSTNSRMLQILEYVKGDIPKVAPLDATVVLKIVTEVARLPHFIADASPLSHSIMQIHCLILAKLQARAGGNADTSSSEDEEIEKCGICDGNIPFESLRWAKCVNNHQYPRCTLSFLAIQTPGTAKACSICNVQYLNEFMVPGMKTENRSKMVADSGAGGVEATQGDSSQEPLISLARILFAACDRCVCCGGKFTG